ncbi:MAG: D-ribose pyranase [Tenericutes bacterium]|nr:D-ribose pyranase [Mycoplasmatota bacterium]
MKKHGILNSEISKVLVDLGHTDLICISDCGLPVPNGVKKIDLALKYGVPTFLEVFTEVEKDMIFEKVYLASEIKSNNPAILESINNITKDVEQTFVTHNELKEITRNCKAIIRTGENTPYANIILQAGLFFGNEG